VGQGLVRLCPGGVCFIQRLQLWECFSVQRQTIYTIQHNVCRWLWMG